MTTGVLPFSGNTSAVMFDAILNRAPVPPSRLNPEVSPELERIILKLLEKDRDLRYQSAAELKADLKRLRRDSHPSSVKIEAVPALAARKPLPKMALAIASGVLVIAAAMAAWWWSGRAPQVAPQSQWTALTDFTDSAVQPAISPDGRMLAFLRGADTFLTEGQIYVKLLPNGDPVQLTHDAMRKFEPVFTPDGSKVAYTAIDEKFNWNTYVVPVLGGEAQMLLPNSEGLRWIGNNRLLFSEITRGIHMTLVTASESRTGERTVYSPPTDRGMAHYSALSPDSTQVLMTEMGQTGEWLPCRLVPFDGHSPGVQVGPPASRCFAVAWSPDGKWMYMNLDTGNGFHLWRQATRNGTPEQISFGPTYQHGIAVAPDGHSLITSVGAARVSVWLHHPPDEDREISSQGLGAAPEFSADGSKLYYLHFPAGSMVAGNLTAVDLKTYRSETLFPDLMMEEYDISPDGKRVVFRTAGKQQLMVASLDRRSAPMAVSAPIPLDEVTFASNDEIYFRALDNGHGYLQRAHLDGTGRHNVSDTPITEVLSISPDRQWVVVAEPASSERSTIRTVARSADGSRSVVLCDYCNVTWSTDEKIIYFNFYFGPGHARQNVAVPTIAGSPFPQLPAHGLTFDEAIKLPGANRLEHSIVPAPVPGVFAYQKTIVQRNIFRIPLN